MYKKIILLLLVLSVTLAEDYYDILSLKRDATQKEIRQQFKKLAVSHHPDKNKEDPDAHEKFIKYTTAYEVLKDPDLRKKYDLYGEEGLNGANKQQNYHSWNYYRDDFGIYDDDPQVVTLSKHDYDDSVVNSEKIWFINFYSPMCSHCHHLAPVWRKIAKDLEGVIRIGAVNCEDDWQLCHQLGIQSYPTLLFYPKNSKHGIRYVGAKTFDDINRFVLDRIDVNINGITKSEWMRILKGMNLERPTLIFTCGPGRDCPISDDRLRISAIFENVINVVFYNCEDELCDNLIASNTGSVYVPMKNDDFWKPIEFDDTTEVESMVQQILEQLPEPRDISADEFEMIRKRLESDNDDGWLLCFYIGHATELDLQLKRLPNIIRDINLGKVNCGKYPKLCTDLNVNRYPMWGVFKPGGAFELSHGKDTINDIAKFAENSVKAHNVWALSAEKILSILKRQNGNEAWFVDWYAPWCPPCIQFLPEVRKASLEFKKSVVHFGTVDCTVHSGICRQYNIRSYPTAMLINGSTTLQFTTQKTAANVVRFIKEAINPTVIHLTSNDFDRKLGKKKSKVLWAVDYFAPWCGPCQQLAPEWSAVAKLFKLLPNVKIASVDCEAQSSLCSSQGIRSYPTIRLYPFGSEGLSQVAMYNGPRDHISLSKWIAQFLPVGVRDFDQYSLKRDVLESNDIWLVDYYAPWCGHCQTLEPQFAIAAQLLDGKVRLGRVNCDLYREQCSHAGVRAYPTLIMYTEKKRSRTIHGNHIISSTRAEKIEQEVLDRLKVTSRKKHDEL
ncbi:dnaJ homolog subfamily C member 10-like [Venturia canescens]|uniref:dnaJ homolog subfamily C member 10-like n=1 Tax=Venturia canescens TaxID=32260 RepID=UPI001C9C7424|nr:dnaJ homolog subfamily C member 10-like [Venturia canescens]XP_043277163.1 dnaJ homolog subfamily C member 10-like [Venturia canescens]